MNYEAMIGELISSIEDEYTLIYLYNLIKTLLESSAL